MRPYTCNDDDLRGAADAARRLGVRVHTHAAEDMHQTQLSVDGRGITPIQVLDETGVLDAGVIIAHGNGIVDADIALLAAHRDRVGVTHGPKGYLKYALGPLTPIRGLLAAGVPVGYCTDGAASNSTLDVFENMRITAITQKHAADDATWFRSGTALQLAGPGAAAVMGQAGMIGELRVGARADVILVDVSGFHCQPLHDLAATLVYCVQALGRAHHHRRRQGADARPPSHDDRSGGAVDRVPRARHGPDRSVPRAHHSGVHDLKSR